jgi:hypothetical protein
VLGIALTPLQPQWNQWFRTDFGKFWPLSWDKGESEMPILIKEGVTDMRSDRVFDALQTLRNRYMLCQLASKATRKFHRPSTRIQETMNGVLDRIAGAERQEILSEPENFAEAQRRAA